MAYTSIDVVGIQPVAREIVHAMAEAYLANLGAALVSLVAHGSAMKGGFIPGSSDVDLAAFIDPAALDGRGELPLEQALSLHANVARIDPHPFRYLQGHVYPAGSGPPVGFIPGAMHVVWGDADVPIAREDDVMQAALSSLRCLEPDTLRSRISNGLMDHGEGRLDRQVRWLCTDVWPAIYQVACLAQGSGMEVWTQTKHEVVSRLRIEPIIGPAATAWFESVTAHYAKGEAIGTALQTIRDGVAVLDAAKAWVQQRDQ